MKTTLFLALILGSAPAFAQAPEVDPARFAEEIGAFAAWDSKNSAPEGAILFVGSSSIRLWATASAFPEQTIINRGFGGSHFSDLNFYYEQIVKPYDASVIVVYEGDNDIAHGKTPARVLADFKKFVDLVRVDSNAAQILFISIKPSIDRWEYWPSMTAANKLIEDFAAHDSSLVYVDLATPLLDEHGLPRDVYVEDKLHLNDYGYQLWNKALAPFLN